MSSLSAGDRPRILVVEDEPVSAALLRRYLEQEGCEVDLAVDGDAALERHRKAPYRVVVSDWMMPGMDGVTLCRKFRELGGPYVYFILCTARTDRDDRAHAFAAGVDDFLTKPMDRDELVARLLVARRILSASDELRVLSRKYADLFQGLPVACFTYDEAGVIQEWNRQAEVSFAIPPERAKGLPVWNVLAVSEATAWTKEHAQALLRGGAPANFDWTIPDGGAARTFATSVIVLRNEEGATIGAVCASLDITARKRAEAQIADYARQVSAQAATLETINAQLRILAITDELTGLPNRRQFLHALEAAMEGVHGGNLPVSLLMMDLDHFKRINDEHGHLVGDDVLRKVARVLEANCMPGELPARYGGEEFAVLMPGADEEQAWRAGERYRAAIERHMADCQQTASVGIATSNRQSSTAADLISRADQALYQAKQSGRNRVCGGDPPLAGAKSP